MGRGGWSGLRVRLFLLVLLAVLPALGIIVRTAVEQRRTAVAEGERAALRLARVASAGAERAFFDAMQFLELLAQYPLVREPVPERTDAFLAELHAGEERFLNIGLLDRQGRVLASALPYDRGVDASERAYFRRALESGLPALGDYQVGQVTGAPSINVGAPVRGPGGEVTSVVFVAIGLDRLARLASEARLPENATVVVLDARGHLLLRIPAAPAESAAPGLHPLARSVIERREGSARLVGLDGTERTYGFVELSPREGAAGAFVAVGIPTAEALAAADAVLRRNLLALLVATALAVGVGWIAGEVLVVRRARALVRVTGELAAGRLEARVGEPYGGGELGALSRATDEMAEALERRERELRRAESRYRSLVEQTPAVFYVAEGASRQVFVGPQVTRLFGFAADEWRTDPLLWERRLHPQDRERALAAAAAAARSGGAFTEEYRLLDREDRPVWVRDSGQGHAEPGGHAVAGFLVDVTEVKRLHDRLLAERQLETGRRLASGVAAEIAAEAERVSRHASGLAGSAAIAGDEAARGHVERLERAAARLASLAGELRSYAGERSLRPVPVNLNVAVERLAPELREALGPDVELRTLLAGGVPDVEVDEGLLRAGLLALARNARASTPAGSTFTLGTVDVQIDGEAGRERGLGPGQYVLLAVSHGGPAEREGGAADPFEPYGVDGPDGLALAALAGLVRQSGGRLERTGGPGLGTTVKIYLPRRR